MSNPQGAHDLRIRLTALVWSLLTSVSAAQPAALPVRAAHDLAGTSWQLVCLLAL